MRRKWQRNYRDARDVSASAPDKPACMTVFVHTIPVPRGWSIEQAWEAISRRELLADPDPYWANIETTEDDKFIRVLDADAEE